MISVGVAVAGRRAADFTPARLGEQTFYRELRPISEQYVPEALAVSGLDRERLVRDGADPAAAMTEHTHHALDDALEQAELFVNLITWSP